MTSKDERDELRAEIDRLGLNVDVNRAKWKTAEARAKAAEADAKGLAEHLGGEIRKVLTAIRYLDPLIRTIEADDSGEAVCHDYDRVDSGQCALLSDLLRVRAALDGDA